MKTPLHIYSSELEVTVDKASEQKIKRKKVEISSDPVAFLGSAKGIY